MPQLYYCEIEFINSEGNVETRSFSRAHSVKFSSDGLEIHASDDVHFYLRRTTRLNYFESGTLASRLNSRDRDELYREVARLCGENKRIPAIKLVRDTMGYGLPEAKAYVDDNFPRSAPLPVDKTFDPEGDVPF